MFKNLCKESFKHYNFKYTLEKLHDVIYMHKGEAWKNIKAKKTKLTKEQHYLLDYSNYRSNRLQGK